MITKHERALRKAAAVIHNSCQPAITYFKGAHFSEACLVIYGAQIDEANKMLEVLETCINLHRGKKMLAGKQPVFVRARIKRIL